MPFIGGYEKQIIAGGAIREVHYVSGGNGLCAILVKEAGIVTPYYVYTDHLGSLLTITNSAGTVVAEQNFDAWGRKRNPINWQYAGVLTTPAWLYRGYTSHEHLPNFTLINMNGRMYDPIQGRMISPDNYVATPFATQGYNRYSYANNNPLSYVDPDGNFAWFIVAAAAIIGGTANGIAYSNNGKNFLGGFWRGALVGGGAALTGGAIAGALPGFGGAVLGGMAGGIVNGGLGAGLNGGDIAQGIMFGAMTGAVGGGVGAYFGGGTGAFIGGVTSGALGSALTGGDILTGALVGGASSVAMYHAMNYYNYSQSSFKTIVNYKQFSRMGGDFQRSLVRRKEFGGVISDNGKYYRAPAKFRNNFSVEFDRSWTGKIQGNPLFSFHTHWARPNLPVLVNSNMNFASSSDLTALNAITSNSPSPGDLTFSQNSNLPGVMVDRSNTFIYNSFLFRTTGSNTQGISNSISLSRYNFVFWPW